MDEHYLIPGSTLTGIADAIREKGGTTAVIATENMAAAIAAIEAGGGNVQFFTLPMGRSRGDINGDGKITTDDAKALQNHMSMIEPLTDALDLWSADVNADGNVAATDWLTLFPYLLGNDSLLTSKPTLEDYYGNWSYKKTGERTGYFYYDVAVGVNTEVTAFTLLVSGYADSFLAPEYTAGTLRVKAKACPTKEIMCAVLFHDGTESMESAPIKTTLEPETRDVSIQNFSEGPVLYVSKNYPNGENVPTDGVLKDVLAIGDLYTVLYDSARCSVSVSSEVATYTRVYIQGTFSKISRPKTDETFDRIRTVEVAKEALEQSISFDPIW